MIHTLARALSIFYHGKKQHIGLLIAFLIPLKLSLTYTIAIPTILLWWIAFVLEVREERRNALYLLLERYRFFVVPMIAFVFFSAFAGLFGFRPEQSLISTAHLAFFCTLFFVYYDIASWNYLPKICAALLSGQAIASIHSVVESAFPGTQRFFLGKVTESGQLSLTLPLSIGLIALLLTRVYREQRPPYSFTAQLLLNSLASFSILMLIGFSLPLGISSTVTILLILLFVVFATAQIVKYIYCKRSDGASQCFLPLLLTLITPPLTVALLVNLKRGPWLGVFCALSIILILYYRKLFPILVCIVVLMASYVEPIRTRIEHSSKDFFISGGRSVIWQIGAELATQYPLGIGLGNSEFLRRFSPEIPPQLRHFHNNFINIIVETGWVGFLIFLWWIVILIYSGLTLKSKEEEDAPIMARAIACALISWQVAGAVEYNFGDSEVTLIFLMLTGFLARLKDITATKPPQPAA